MLASCSNDLGGDMGIPDSFWKDTMGGCDDPIVFIHEKDYGAFIRLSSLSDRFQACSVPDGILKEKTTRALGLSILHYPLNSIFLFYNYYDLPVKIIYENSPLHRELSDRRDAADELTGIFEKTGIDKDKSLIFSKSYEKIILSDELFLELYLGSGLVKGLDKGRNKERLAAAVTRKRDERLADPELNGDLALIPLAYMSERLGLGVRFSDETIQMMHEFTLRDNLWK